MNSCQGEIQPEGIQSLEWGSAYVVFIYNPLDWRATAEFAFEVMAPSLSKALRWGVDAQMTLWPHNMDRSNTENPGCAVKIEFLPQLMDALAWAAQDLAADYPWEELRW